MNEPHAEDATQRFSPRADDYARYRPGYPSALFDHIMQACALAPGDLVIDVGAGTGLLTRSWLARDLRVCAVEPNAAMRARAALALAGEASLTISGARAEALSDVDDASAALVCAAQAFHWFEPQTTRREFVRVLRPGAQVALIWNERDDDASRFMRAYAQFLRRFANPSREATARRRSPAHIACFFAPRKADRRTFANAQVLDLAGLRGRLLSSSYAPLPGTPAYAPMLAELEQLFAAHARDGRVEIVYRTLLFHGVL